MGIKLYTIMFFIIFLIKNETSFGNEAMKLTSIVHI